MFDESQAQSAMDELTVLEAPEAAGGRHPTAAKQSRPVVLFAGSHEVRGIERNVVQLAYGLVARHLRVAVICHSRKEVRPSGEALKAACSAGGERRRRRSSTSLTGWCSWQRSDGLGCWPR